MGNDSSKSSSSSSNNTSSNTRRQTTTNTYPGSNSITQQRVGSTRNFNVPPRNANGTNPRIQRAPQQSGRRFRVTVPQGVKPGDNFSVVAEGERYLVKCPENVRPNTTIEIVLPASTPFMVTVPNGVVPGQKFNVEINGRQVSVTCPNGVRPGDQVRIRLPPSALRTRPPEQHMPMYEVAVPPGVLPGQPFMLMAGNRKVTVKCPPNVKPGQKIRFHLPPELLPSDLEAYKLNYGKDGWVRVMGNDYKWHWVYHTEESKENSKEDLDDGDERLNDFSFISTGFVRQLKIKSSEQKLDYDNNDDDDWNHMLLNLVKAEEASLETTVRGTNIGYKHISEAVNLDFDAKLNWFRMQCQVIRKSWEEGHIGISVRRDFILEDTLTSFSRLTADDMRSVFRFEFIGEPGIDAGGVAREFYQLTTSQIFNPDFGLFQYSSVNQMCMQINPLSNLTVDHHLQYFHLAGRLMAKALLDGHIVAAHLVRPLYKHLLGWPVGFSDLEHLDHEVYNSLLLMKDTEDVADICVDFSISEDFLGEKRTIPLVPNGENIPVTNNNFGEYLIANIRYRLFDRVQKQIKAMLIGFYEVIPEALLSIFDFQEIELLLCGLPDIDMDDWYANTVYVNINENHKVVRWFWQVVRNFSREQKARLLQFATGTAGVPAQGFSFLQGNDGRIRHFTINSISRKTSIFPRAHTCFNRIDLPLYNTKDELKQYLSLAIQLEATGFDID